jgi:NADPH2:quinone reductase
VKAARIHAWGEPPRIDELPEPAPLPGRSLVRMAATSVSHLDRSIAAGGFLRHPPLPYVPGVEAAGTIVQSERFAVGARVWLRGAGLGTSEDGTWRETISAPDESIGLLPEAIAMPLGAAFFSPCTAAWVALFDVGALQPGERVLISGASGAVGSIAVQLAGAAGVEVAVAEDSPAAVDLLIDCVGGPGLAALIARVAPGGRAVLVGYTAGQRVELDLAELMQRDVRLLPLNMLRRAAKARAAVPEILARLADGRLRLALRPFALTQAAEAMDWIAQRGHRGRAVLTTADQSTRNTSAAPVSPAAQPVKTPTPPPSRRKASTSSTMPRNPVGPCGWP